MLDIGSSPAATLLRHMDTDEFELMNSKTLPRRLGSQLSYPGTAAAAPAAPAAEPSTAAADCARPLQRLQPPRPMTLPTRGAAQRVRRAEQANVVERQSDENRNEPCESPSYMTHPSYKFPEPQETNALPLPSREGKKQVKTSAKRHVRKYPLIIPANGVQRTLSKVADFGDASPQPQQQTLQHQQQHQQQTRSIEVVAAVRSSSVRSRPDAREYENMPAIAGEATAAHTYQNLDKLEKQAPADAAGLTDSASLQFESILEGDMSKEGMVLQSPDVTDGFYNFSIQKEHYNKSKDVGFEPAQVTGLYVNDDELRNLDKPLAASNSSTTLDSAAVPQEMAPTAASAAAAVAAAAASATAAEEPLESISTRRFAGADNELAGNALFKKVRASVNQAMNRNSINGSEVANNNSTPASKPQTEAEYFAATAARLADSNSVSCEDLLEFSDKKPRGCERGVDSDEVRIMVKVLGKDVSSMQYLLLISTTNAYVHIYSTQSTPTRCLAALEFINWDVHKSIKLIKLQNILGEANLSLSAAFEALQQQEWDLHTTAVKLKGVKL